MAVQGERSCADLDGADRQEGGSRANLHLYFNSKPQLVMPWMREVEELCTALDELPDPPPETMLGGVDRARQV